jgi:hypothetical protein
MRVKIVKEFVMESFPAKPLLNYALEVEKITTSKKPNLILNVDGVIAVSFVDLLRHSGSFTRYVTVLSTHAIVIHSVTLLKLHTAMGQMNTEVMVSSSAYSMCVCVSFHHCLLFFSV